MEPDCAGKILPLFPDTSGVTTAARLGRGTIADVRCGVRSLARVLSGPRPPAQRTPQGFDPALIRADVDPVQLADRLAESGAHPFSLCLQGPPGTGKSAFVRHLAERLGVEVLQKRASDLMSKWLGETEQQIAEAFAEARDAEAFLVFDETDSLLADRRLAQRSWEVSQVNEMLTWMESHPLPFACTTNFGDRLDPAALRRFTFKITLDYLSPEQARAAFRGYFDLAPPAEIADLAALTSGDFSVVRRKAEILHCLGDSLALTKMLRAACDAKPNGPRKAGFWSVGARDAMGSEANESALQELDEGNDQAALGNQRAEHPLQQFGFDTLDIRLGRLPQGLDVGLGRQPQGLDIGLGCLPQGLDIGLGRLPQGLDIGLGRQPQGLDVSFDTFDIGLGRQVAVEQSHLFLGQGFGLLLGEAACRHVLDEFMGVEGDGLAHAPNRNQQAAPLQPPW